MKNKILSIDLFVLYIYNAQPKIVVLKKSKKSQQRKKLFIYSKVKYKCVFPLIKIKYLNELEVFH
jgi:hypothetical protein